MGLPLRNFSPSLTSGPTPPGGPSGTPDSDPDLDRSEPACHRNRHRHTKSPHRACRGARCRLGLKAQCNRSRRPQARARQHHHQAYALPVVAETHHVKPRNPWAADADEGYALAQSALRLPGEQYHNPAAEQVEGRARQSGRSRSRSASTSSSSSGSSRPPSLERQDAFRDEKTVKRRRGRGGPRASSATSASTWVEDEQHSPAHLETDLDASETAELYRMGLLYDDEHERGAGFSLDAIARDPEEPVYSLRVRPARRGRRDERDDRGGNAALSVDLAFSAFGEDEALAGWLLSGSCSQGAVVEEPRPWTEAAHDTHNPRLTVIYELADDADSAVSGDDFLDSVSVSEVSYCGEDDERVWALSDGCNAAPGTAASVVEVEGDVGPWVVLGHDGS